MTEVHWSKMGKIWKGVEWKLYSKLLWTTNRKKGEKEKYYANIRPLKKINDIVVCGKIVENESWHTCKFSISQRSSLIVFYHYISTEYHYYFSIRLCCKSTVEFGSWHLNPLSPSFIICKMRNLDEIISNVINN